MSSLKQLTLQSHDRTIIKDMSRVLEALKTRYGLTLTDVLRRNEENLDHFLGLLDEIEADCGSATQRSIAILRRKLLITPSQSRTPETHQDWTPRQGERLAVALKVVVYSEMVGLLCGRSLDVSLNGMRVEVERPIPNDAVIDLMFTLGLDHHEYLHKIRAMVASSQGTSFGLMFIGVEPETYTALEAYLGISQEP